MIKDRVVLVSVPGLRAKDLEHMPHLSRLVAGGDRADLVPSFPAVTCPVQANMTTGVPPSEHGVVANGFFWRNGSAHRNDAHVEMWTSSNECVQRPQLWDILREHHPEATSAVWFPLHSKGCGATYLCTPSPIHNADGSESLWCATSPSELYPELVERLGDFPLQHFWGPLANIRSTAWIVDSAVIAAERYRPNLFYLYLPHLDYAAQKFGPDSEQALAAVQELDRQIARLADGFGPPYADAPPLWLWASEYVITPVGQVIYPNRTLREAGLLQVADTPQGTLIDFENSRAWALADHQVAHIFLRDADASVRRQVQDLLQSLPGVAEVFEPADAPQYDLAHPRSGELVAAATSDAWFAYYWWLADDEAPAFARTVDIHRKPGYDPVELFFDPQTRGIPLDASLVRGSHGAPAITQEQRGVLLSSQRGVFVERPLADTDVADIVLRQFGI
jgi:predicted AlkP superfamily pyrophosphatase or phosphodiesterase